MIFSEDEILDSFQKFYRAEVQQKKTVQWPSAFPLQRMTFHKYRLREFGSLLIMHEKEPFKEECICSFSPWEGNDVPYLLAAYLVNEKFPASKKESAVISYYDHTGKNPDMKRLQNLVKKYNDLADLPKEDKWYEKNKTAYSLAKSGEADQLRQLIRNSIGIYMGISCAAGKDVRNLRGLKNLRRKMKEETMPYTEMLEKMLGKEQYLEFLYQEILPVNEKGEMRK